MSNESGRESADNVLSFDEAFKAWAESSNGIRGGAETKLNADSIRKYRVIWERWLKYVGVKRWLEANGTDLKLFLHNGLTPSRTTGDGEGGSPEERKAARDARAVPGASSSVTKRRYATVIMEIYQAPDILAGLVDGERWGPEGRDIPKSEDMMSAILTQPQRDAFVAQLDDGWRSSDVTTVRNTAMCSLMLMEGLTCAEVIAAKPDWIRVFKEQATARIEIEGIGETRGESQARWVDLSPNSLAALNAWAAHRKKVACRRQEKPSDDRRLFVPAPNRTNPKRGELTPVMVHRICAAETRSALGRLGPGHTSAHEGPAVLRNTCIMTWMRAAAAMATPDFEGVRQKAGFVRVRSLARFAQREPRVLEVWNAIYKSVAE